MQNEFGETDIDGELVALKQDLGAEEVVVLNNGCLCCSVRGDLVKTLESLLERRSSFDHIVIETTGLANPAPILQTFFAEPNLFQQYAVDGVVTVVDAKVSDGAMPRPGVPRPSSRILPRRTSAVQQPVWCLTWS